MAKPDPEGPVTPPREDKSDKSWLSPLSSSFGLNTPVRPTPGSVPSTPARQTPVASFPTKEARLSQGTDDMERRLQFIENRLEVDWDFMERIDKRLGMLEYKSNQRFEYMNHKEGLDDVKIERMVRAYLRDVVKSKSLEIEQLLVRQEALLKRADLSMEQQEESYGKLMELVWQVDARSDAASLAATRADPGLLPATQAPQPTPVTESPGFFQAPLSIAASAFAGPSETSPPRQTREIAKERFAQAEADYNSSRIFQALLKSELEGVRMLIDQGRRRQHRTEERLDAVEQAYEESRKNGVRLQCIPSQNNKAQWC